MDTLLNLPEFGFEAAQVYKSTLDMNQAINEAQRMSQIAKAKAEAQAITDSGDSVINEPVEVIDKPKTWVRFAACMTVDQAYELKKFFDERHIEFKAV